MLNLNIPELMEDELLYSLIVRMAEEIIMPVDNFAKLYVCNDFSIVPLYRSYILSIGTAIYIY